MCMYGTPSFPASHSTSQSSVITTRGSEAVCQFFSAMISSGCSVRRTLARDRESASADVTRPSATRSVRISSSCNARLALCFADSPPLRLGTLVAGVAMSPLYTQESCNDNGGWRPAAGGLPLRLCGRGHRHLRHFEHLAEVS